MADGSRVSAPVGGRPEGDSSPTAPLLSLIAALVAIMALEERARLEAEAKEKAA